MRTSLRRCQWDRSHPKRPTPPPPPSLSSHNLHPHLLPTSRAFWEGCPSSACIPLSTWAAASCWHSIKVFHFPIICFVSMTLPLPLLSLDKYSFSYRWICLLAVAPQWVRCTCTGKVVEQQISNWLESLCSLASPLTLRPSEYIILVKSYHWPMTMTLDQTDNRYAWNGLTSKLILGSLQIFFCLTGWFIDLSKHSLSGSVIDQDLSVNDRSSVTGRQRCR